MSSSDLLKIYSCMNGLLILGYLIFLIIKKLSVKFNIRLSFRSNIYLAQFLIAVSAATPVAFHHLPQKTFPQIQWIGTCFE